MTTLLDRLAARAKKTATEKGRGRSAFLALKPEIQAAIDQGWTAKEIWELLKDEGKIAISYSVFIRYIRDGGMRGGALLAPSKTGETTTAEGVSAVNESKNSSVSASTTSFKFDSKPNKGSLV